MNTGFAIHAAAALLTFTAHLASATPLPVTNAPPVLHNVFRLTPRVLSGSQPEGDGAFAWLAAQGVKTVLSVDGARPDVEAARKHGFRYVHLPIGYDGVPSNRATAIAKLAATATGPIYVHCHHGKHRGPAAAAMVCEASDNWTAVESESFLQQAGTSPDYPGLYRSVRDFRAPGAAALAGLTNALPEVTPPPGLVQAMVTLDAQLERLRACQKAGWRTPPAHPDVAPRHEATQLLEQFHELARSKEVAGKPPGFAELLQSSEKATDELRGHLSASGSEAEASKAFSRVTDNCASCHKKYRN